MEAIRNTFAVSLQGASHIKKEELAKKTKEERSFPCQDKSSSRFFPQDDSHKTSYYLTVACDGHGGAPYFRSAKGAELAISSIEKIIPIHIDEISRMLNESSEDCLSQSNGECLSQFLEEKKKKILSLIVPSLLTEWKNAVASDIAENPITEKELDFLEREDKKVASCYREALEEKDFEKANKELRHIYGATFLCVVVTENFWFALQIGDGDIAIHDENGFSFPVPEDERNFLNVTTSLCDANAENEFRLAFGTNKLDGVICSTDGIANSFASKEQLISFYERVLFVFRMYQFNREKECASDDWKEVAKKRAEFAENEIKQALPNLSKLGSGDDVTLAGFVDISEDDVKNAFLATKLIEEGKKASAGSSEAEKKFLEAASLGLPEACYEAGNMLCTKSPNEAIPYLEKAVEGGIKEAKEKLIPLLFEVAKSFQKKEEHAEAFKHFLKAAEYGVKEAQYEVGLYFGRPQDYAHCGVCQDFSKAIKWTFAAANQGYALAECKLGKCYRDGRGVQQDAEFSLEWYRKASEHGSLEAKDYLKKLEEKDATKATEETPMEAFEYEVHNGKYILKKLKDASLKDIVIPSVFYRIGKEAFNRGENLTNITIGNSITKIEKWAFNGCLKLKNVTIPASIIEIGKCAFSECANLETITIPASVKKIGDGAFSLCFALESIAIPDSVTEIKAGTFMGCSKLTNVMLPSSITKIEKMAFIGCPSLKNLTLSNSITEIGESAFEHCSSLTSVTLPASLTKIRDWVFSGCSNLKDLTILGSLTKIGDWAFWSCSSLKSITLPPTITRIGISAFENCSGLENITIPHSVIRIDREAFRGCSSLTTLVIQSSIITIDDESFFECNSLKSVSIENPNFKKSDIKRVFGSSPSFKEIKIGNNIVKVSELD